MRSLMPADYFETEDALQSYLLSQYGTPEQTCTLHPAARNLADFAYECVKEPLRHFHPERRRRALDLGCGTGRSTFELRQFFDEVVGIDQSNSFIEAAEKMRRERAIATPVERFKGSRETLRLELPSHLNSENVVFKQGDACALDSGLGLFDLVNMTQLIDRVSDPESCLRLLSGFVSPGGWLVITSTCSWWDNYTPREKWLGGGARGITKPCQAILSPHFSLHNNFQMHYFLRENPHWYEWTVAEVSIWHRTDVLARL